MTRAPRSVTRVLFLALAVLVIAPAAARAVSLRDLMELSKAGLSDEVLVALVEADDTVYNLDGPRILELRAAGVSERVIVAMLRKKPAADPAADAAVAPLTEFPTSFEPVPPASPVQVIVQQAAPAPEPARVVLVPWWPVLPPAHPPGTVAPATTRRGFGRFMNDGWVERPGGARTRP